MRFALSLAVAAAPAVAQVQQLFESPAATVSQSLGLTRIDVSYHRPAVKGRAIWGALVPFGEVWRAGANDATTIAFSTEVKVAGKPVPKGTYALFMIPGKETWTVILNADAKLWGAYGHKPEQDVLRFEVRPEPAPHQEWLTYGLDLQGRTTARLTLGWEKLRVGFPIEADVDGLYRAHLKEELAKAETKAPKEAWPVYFQAGKYHLNGGRVAEAAPLLEKAHALVQNFWTCEWAARLRQAQGRTAEALPLLARAKELATGKAPKAYVDGLDTLRAEWTRQ